MVRHATDRERDITKVETAREHRASDLLDHIFHGTAVTTDDSSIVEREATVFVSFGVPIVII